MPGTAKIDREQRDGIYELVRNHLAGIGDVAVALEDNEDIATAERLAIELGEDFRLLDDIGWRPDEERDVFELTMPPHDLMELLRRLQGDAARLLEGSPDRAQVSRRGRSDRQLHPAPASPLARSCWTISTRASASSIGQPTSSSRTQRKSGQRLSRSGRANETSSIG